jgi:hypothetical protein
VLLVDHSDEIKSLCVSHLDILSYHFTFAYLV